MKIQGLARRGRYVYICGLVNIAFRLKAGYINKLILICGKRVKNHTLILRLYVLSKNKFPQKVEK